MDTQQIEDSNVISREGTWGLGMVKAKFSFLCNILIFLTGKRDSCITRVGKTSIFNASIKS